MAAKLQRGELKAMFRENGASLVDPDRLLAAAPSDKSDPVSRVHDVAREKQHEGHAKATQVKMGLGDAAELMGGLVAHSSVYAMNRRRDEDEKASRQQADDNLFLLLIAQNNIPAAIAHALVESMSDAEIADVVADIEARTGMPIEAYAEKILGAEVAQRRPGETDAEYKKRMLREITEEITGPDGKLKDKYKNDAGAQAIASLDKYGKAVSQTADVKQLYESGDQEAAIEKASQIEGYNDSDVTGNAVEVDVLSAAATGGQDGARDEATNSTGLAEESDSVLGDLLGPADPKATGALADAKQMLETDFPKAAAPDDQYARSSSLTPDARSKPGATT